MGNVNCCSLERERAGRVECLRTLNPVYSSGTIYGLISSFEARTVDIVQGDTIVKSGGIIRPFLIRLGFKDECNSLSLFLIGEMP